MSGARLLAALATAAVVAVVSGCGGSSSHSGSAGGAHGAGGSHSAGSSHYRTYTGPGFTLSIPAGWRQEGAASAAGGAMGMALAPPDHSASLAIHVYPNSNQGIDQTIATTLGSDQLEASQGAIRDLHWHVRTAAVTGASAAKELTETYTNAGGRQRYTGLMVLSGNGTLIVVESIASPRAPATYPGPVFDSFRLAGGGVSSAA